MLRQLRHLPLIENNIIRQNPILISSKPRPRRFLAREILRIAVGSDSITDIESVDLFALGDDFARGVVAWDSVRDYWPGVSSVGDVGVAVVERDGVDFDEDFGGFEGEGEGFVDEFEAWRAGGVVVCAAEGFSCCWDGGGHSGLVLGVDGF